MNTGIFANVGLFSDVSWTHAASSFALWGFCVVYLCLVVAIVTQRAVLTVTGERKADEFPATGEGGSAFSYRLHRAHANMYENFPLWGVLLLAIATDQTTVTDGLALYCLGARIGQVTTHLISTNERAVQLRFGFFIMQLGIVGYWLVQFGILWLG